MNDIEQSSQVSLREALRQRFHDEYDRSSDFGCVHHNQYPASWDCEKRVRDFDDLLAASDSGEVAGLRGTVPDALVVALAERHLPDGSPCFCEDWMAGSLSPFSTMNSEHADYCERIRAALTRPVPETRETDGPLCLECGESITGDEKALHAVCIVTGWHYDSEQKAVYPASPPSGTFTAAVRRARAERALEGASDD